MGAQITELHVLQDQSMPQSNRVELRKSLRKEDHGGREVRLTVCGN